MTSLQGSNEAGTYQSARYQQKLNAQGLLIENFPAEAAANSIVLVSGTVYAVSQGLLGGDQVTGLAWSMSIVGSGLTLARAGIYNRANQLIAQSLDVSATFNSGAIGKVKNPLAGLVPFTCPLSDGCYGAIIVVGTTGPTLLRGSSGPAVSPPLPGAALATAATMTGQADLPATLVPAFVATTYCLWNGLY